jgi:peptidoglycan/xylan/chitin deacetylase (PgdA/CDA1 family)
MYHHVSDVPGLVTVSPRTFRAQMQYLKEAGWKTLSLSEVEAFFLGAPTPKKSALITFDDGYADNYIHAFPILEELGLRATIFVITSTLRDLEIEREGTLPGHKGAKEIMRGNHPERAALTWPEVERMRKSGWIEFASHTHTHRRWDREVPDPKERRQAMKEDLALSASILQKRLDAPCRHLCWPWGIYDSEMIDQARKAGFEYFYTTERGINLPSGASDRIKRFVVKEKGAAWMRGQLAIYSRPTLGRVYAWLRGTA